MDLVKKENDFELAMQDISQTQRMCDLLMKTPHYAKMGPEGIFAISSKAKSLGIPIVDALGGALYFVQGKVGMGAETMASLIRQAGHSIIKDPKSDNTICILHGKRKDNGDTWTVSFSMEDARRAGLAKNMYDKYPAIMLYNRAMSMLARQLYPDVIKGAGYTMEELREISDHRNQKFEAIEDHRQVEYVEVKQEKKEQVITLNEEQVKNLENYLDLCDEKYRKTILDRFNQLIPAIKSFYDIPFPVYEKAINAIKIHLNYETVKIEDEKVSNA